MIPFLLSFTVFGYSLNIPSYGVFLALGFTAAYLDAMTKAKRFNLDPKHVEAQYILIIFGAIAGSRLFHVVFEEFDYYVQHPAKIFAVWEGGYTFYGAVIFCLIALYLYGRAKKLHFLGYGDLAAGGTAIGLFIGRIGCFLAGCCWGKPSSIPWAVKFTHPQSFCPIRDQALHPAQLYEAFGALLIYVYLTFLARRRKYEGQILFHGIALYAIARFIVECFRGDDSRGYILRGSLSYSQVVSLCLLPLALAGIWDARRNSKRLTHHPR